MDGVTQGFSKGDPLHILKKLGAWNGDGKFQAGAKEIGQGGKKR